MLNRRGLIKGFFGGLIGSTVVDADEWEGLLTEKSDEPDIPEPYIPDPIELTDEIKYTVTGF